MKRILCVILTLLMLLPAVVSCQKEEVTEEVLVQLNVADYTLVRSSNADKYLTRALTEWKKSIDEATGGAFELKDDFVPFGQAADSSTKEILIGKTNRAESEQVYAEMGNLHRYVIRQVGNKIVVAAPTTELLQEAMKYLSVNYFAKSAKNGTFPLAENMNYVSEDIPYLELVADGAAQYGVVYNSDGASQMNSVAKKITNIMNKAATKDATDLMDDTALLVSGGLDASRKMIVVGNPKFPAVEAIGNAGKYMGWRLVNDANHIFAFGLDAEATEGACDALVELLTCGLYVNESGYLRIGIPEEQGGMVEDWADNAPIYTEGTLSHTENFSRDMYSFYYTGTNKTEFNAYCQKVTENGYTLYAKNTIGDNMYYTYKDSKSMLHVYYENDSKTARVLMAPIAKMVDYPLAPVSDGNVTEQNVILMDMDYSKQTHRDNGMGFIFTMKDGSYVVVDGGWGHDSETFYQYLKNNNKRADGKIVIRAWIITHPHEDHYGNIVQFSQTHLNDVTVEYLVGHFATGSLASSGAVDDDIAKIYSAFNRFKDAKQIVPQVGQKMYFGEAEFEFLYTIENLYPTTTTDGNTHSIVFRVNFGGQSFLITGDIQVPGMKKTVKTMGAHLKSDYLQVPHHGLDGLESFFRAVNPKYAFMCTAKDKAEERYLKSSSALPVLKNQLNVKQFFVADDGYTVLKLPYSG
ncbi:MAG: MBL fold metallo-hydrolase [Clostridia bacterium]|nr:MBL fold metallo-hydrolase [Clostridia bacterium]